ncbi:uncharacterized protein VTP21DRAFT_379 [Calcarisporiella thermophila]|uniref:uncharacterized protein n=1 Tax=Calcarisporiella thermophila TaxID=911321 RepID=UPI0037432A8F
MEYVISRVQEEIALDGAEGCDLPRMWSFAEQAVRKRVEELGENIAPVIDNAYKSYLWRVIVNSNWATFFENLEQNVTTEADVTPSGKKTSKVVAKKLNYRPLKISSDTPYVQIAEKYGDQLRIVVSQKYRDAVVLTADQTLSEACRIILDRIAKARSTGASQIDISRDLDLDSRSVFHYIKELLNQKLIIKFPIISMGKYTQLCVHVRFCEQNKGYQTSKMGGVPAILGSSSAQGETPIFVEEDSNQFYSDGIRQKISDLLDAAANKVMVVEDLIKGMNYDVSTQNARRIFNRQIQFLARKGYIERLNVLRKDNKKGSDRCIRLLKPYGTSSTRADVPSETAMLTSIPNDPAERSEEFLIDLPLTSQIYRLIQISGEHGVSSVELRQKLSKVSIKALQARIDRLMKAVPEELKELEVERRSEFHGKQRQFRYFVQSALQAQPAMESSGGGIEASVGSSKQAFDVIIKNTKMNRSLKRKSPPSSTASRRKNATTTPKRLPVSRMSSKSAAAEDAERPGTTPSKHGVAQSDTSIGSGSTTASISRIEITTPKSTRAPLLVSETPVSSHSTPSATPVHTPMTGVTSEQRRQALLSLLETHRILELNTRSISTYDEEFARLYGGTPFKTDRKTLTRLADAMEEKGMLQKFIVSFPILNGTHKAATFLMHSEASQSDEDIKQYVAQVRTRYLYNMLGGSTTKQIKIREVDMEVERIGDIRKRLAPDTEDPEATPMPQRTESEIAEHVEEHWITIAQGYGFIEPRMLRAKWIHLWLLQLVDPESKLDSRVDTETRTIPASALMESMPLELYLKAIGQRSRNTLLDNYIKASQPIHIKLSELPEPLRGSLLRGEQRKMRVRLRRSLNILMALDLVRPHKLKHEDPFTEQFQQDLEERAAHSESSLFPAYLVTCSARMHNFAENDKEPLGIYEVETVAQGERYWKDLQYLCTKQASAEENLEDQYEAENEDEEPRAIGFQGTENMQRELFNYLTKFICRNREWRVDYHYSLEQRMVLEQHASRRAGLLLTPDENQIRRLANELSLPSEAVQDFFNKKIMKVKIATYYQRMKEQRTRQSRTPRTRRSNSTSIDGQQPQPPQVSDGISDKLTRKFAELRKFRGQKEPKSSVRLHKRLGRKRRNKKADREQEGSTQTDENLEEYTRTRHRWTPEADEIMLLAVAINRHRSRSTGKYFWRPVTQLFPNLSPEQCKRRSDVLFKDHMKQARLNVLIQRWDDIYRKGIQCGDIVDPHPSDPNDYDMKSFYDYFAQRLREESETGPPNTPLPRDPALVEQLFDISTSADSHSASRIDDLYSSRTSLKMGLLVSHGLPLVLFSNDSTISDMTYQSCEQVDDEKLYLLKVLIKMILMTPKTSYNSKVAFTVLNYFHQELISRVLDLEKKHGTMTKIKPGRDRRLPGRGVSFTEKFFHTLVGDLPMGIFAQATTFHQQQLNNQMEIPSNLSNSGAMACFLNKLAHGSLTLDAKNLHFAPLDQLHSRKVANEFTFDVVVTPIKHIENEQTPKEEKQPATTEKSSFSLSKLFSFSLFPARKRKNLPESSDSSSQGNPSKRPRRSPSIPEDTDGKPDDVEMIGVQYDSEEEKHELLSLYRVIRDAGEKGLSLIDIKNKLQETSSSISDQTILKHIKSLTSVENPPIARVGINTIRFVDQQYTTAWMVKLREAEEISGGNQPFLEESPTQPNITPLLTQGREKNMSIPRMWIDIRGKVIETVLIACIEVVLDLIVRKPGIYESNIQRLLDVVLTRGELKDILDHLIQKGAVRTQTIKKPSVVSLFSQDHFFEEHDSPLIDKDLITCYWANPDYYTKYLP